MIDTVLQQDQNNWIVVWALTDSNRGKQHNRAARKRHVKRFFVERSHRSANDNHDFLQQHDLLNLLRENRLPYGKVEFPPPALA